MDSVHSVVSSPLSETGSHTKQKQQPNTTAPKSPDFRASEATAALSFLSPQNTHVGVGFSFRKMNGAWEGMWVHFQYDSPCGV